MADSFCMIPSKSDPPVAALKQENAILKAQLEEERKRLAMAERALKQRQEQDNHLRESIMLARKEVSTLSTLPGLYAKFVVGSSRNDLVNGTRSTATTATGWCYPYTDTAATRSCTNPIAHITCHPRGYCRPEDRRASSHVAHECSESRARSRGAAAAARARAGGGGPRDAGREREAGASC